MALEIVEAGLFLGGVLSPGLTLKLTLSGVAKRASGGGIHLAGLMADSLGSFFFQKMVKSSVRRVRLWPRLKWRMRASLR